MAALEALLCSVAVCPISKRRVCALGTHVLRQYTGSLNIYFDNKCRLKNLINFSDGIELKPIERVLGRTSYLRILSFMQATACYLDKDGKSINGKNLLNSSRTRGFSLNAFNALSFETGGS